MQQKYECWSKLSHCGIENRGVESEFRLKEDSVVQQLMSSFSKNFI